MAFENEKVNNWDFSQGYLPEGGNGFSSDDIRALSKRWHHLRIEEVKHRVAAILSLLACRVLGSGSSDVFIPLAPPDMRPSHAYHVVPIKAEGDSGILYSLLLSPKAGQYVLIEDRSYEALCDELNQLSPLERTAWAETVLLNGSSVGCAVTWASEESVQQRLRYRELRRRVRKLPSEVRQRIDLDSALECVIPKSADSRAPDHGYFVLPVRSLEIEEAFETLLLPPERSRPTVIPWHYSSELVASLIEKEPSDAAKWIDTMIEEFGLREGEINAWVPPKYDGSKKSMDRLAMFMRELRTAQGREFLVRKAAIIACLNEQGLSAPLGFMRHVAIPKSETNFDPELASYVVEVRYEPSIYCVLSFPEGCPPIITTCSYEWVRECLESGDKAELRKWIRAQAERGKDEDGVSGEGE